MSHCNPECFSQLSHFRFAFNRKIQCQKIILDCEMNEILKSGSDVFFRRNRVPVNFASLYDSLVSVSTLRNLTQFAYLISRNWGSI